MTDTPQGRSETNEAAGEIRTLAARALKLRTSDRDLQEYIKLAEQTLAGGATLGLVAGMALDLRDAIAAASSVSGGASTCDRPGQTDAAVAEAEEENPCADVLRGLASYLGVGGYNAITVDPREFDRKIRDGIDIVVAPFVRDAERYRKLRNTGAAPNGTLHLEQSLVFVGTNLDRFLDCALAGKPIAPSQAVEMDPTQWPELPKEWSPEAALRAAQPGEQNDGWRPIETAPKDGTWVDLWVVPNGKPYGTSQPGRVSDAWFADGKWRWLGPGSDAESDLEDAMLFHWRPLPTPPTAAPSEGTGEEDVRASLAKGFNAALEQIATEVGKTPRQVLDEAKAFIRRAPTAAAPAPGHDGESDAAFLASCGGKLFQAVFNVLCGEFKDREIEYGQIEDVARRVVRLARREPTRLKGDVTQAQVEVGAKALAALEGNPDDMMMGFEDDGVPTRYTRPRWKAHLEKSRAALEAAASAAPSDAGGKEGRS